MNKELETIIENEFDCLIDDLGCLVGEDWIANNIKEAVTKAFVLGGVVSTSKCDHEPRYYDTKYTSCNKCNKVLQIKP